MIRILRLLEYEFDDNETAELHMGRWAVPANGHAIHGKITIRSAIITNLVAESKTYTIDATSPNIIVNDKGVIDGFVTHWNRRGAGEAIVQFLDGSADSAIFTELRFLHGPDAAREYLNAKGDR